MSESYRGAVVVAGVLLAVGLGTWLTLGHLRSSPAVSDTEVRADARQPAPLNTASITPTSGQSEPPLERVDMGLKPEEADTEVLAYYFHRTTRCDACLAIEAYTEEAILQNFSEFLEDGRLEWQAVNIEEPGNEHFEDDFQLATQSVVLVEMVNGEAIRWTKLEKVWDLLNDALAFQEYVVEEVWVFLGG